MTAGKLHTELVTFGRTLRKLRKSKGLSLREADARCGIDYGEISKIETAKKGLEVATLRKLLSGLEADTNELTDIIVALVYK